MSKSTICFLTMATIVTGCAAPSLHTRVGDDIQRRSSSAEERLAQMKGEFDAVANERQQEVNAPYLFSQSAPLARNFTLPVALQKGMKTAVKFQGSWVNISTFAERIMIATGITVHVAQDVYIEPSLLQPRTREGAGQNTPAPSTSPSLPAGLQLQPGIPVPVQKVNELPLIPATSSGGEMVRRSGGGDGRVESVNGFDFPQTEGAVADILDMVCVRLGLHWKYDETKNTIKIYRLVTKSWATPFGVASNSYSTNFDGGTSDSTNSKSISKRVAAPSVSVKSAELNELKSLVESLNVHMSKVGTATANPATGTITMVDTQEAVEAASRVIEADIRALSSTVLFSVQTIQITRRSGSDQGVDFSQVVNKALSNMPNLTFSANSPASTMPSAAGVVKLGVLSGTTDTQAFLKSLAEIGDVQASTEQPMRTRNRRAAYYTVRKAFSYAESTTPAASTSATTSTGTPGITPAQESVGLKLMIYPAISGKDSAMVTMSIDQSVLEKIDVFTSGQGTSQSSIQLPSIAGEGSVQEAPIRSGQTLVFSGFDSTSDQYDKRSIGESLPIFFGGTQSASKKRTVTLILISAKINEASTISYDERNEK